MDEFTEKLKKLAIQEFLDGHNTKYIATSLTFRINEHVDERDVLEIIRDKLREGMKSCM